MRYFFITTILHFAVLFGNAQTFGEGMPLSWGMPEGASANIIWYELPALNLDSLQNLQQNASEAYKFAEFIPRLFDPQNAGRWTNLAGGDRLWTIGIGLGNAFSLTPIFDQLVLPTGAKLFIYSEDREFVVGPFDRNNLPAERKLAPVPIRSNRVIIEYYEPYPVRGQGRLRVAGATAGFLNLNNVVADVTCYHAITDEERRSMSSAYRSCVLLLTDKGQRLSSGVLVNNTKNDGSPMVLTAAAAFQDGNFSYTAAVFRFDDPGSQESVASWDRAVYGASALSSDLSAGIQLILLDYAPKNSWGTFLCGWNRTPPTGQAFVNFHFGLGQPLQSSFSNNGIAISDQVYTLSNRVYGGALAGSIGSPLFNMNGEVIGVLTRAEGRCSSASDEVYASMSGGWQQLKNFLAPILPESLFQPGLSFKGTEEKIIDDRFIYCYPNPSDELITVCNQSGENISVIRITDFTGKIVMELTSPEDKIDISQLASGNYIIQYSTSKESIREKLAVR